jgi:dipeptidase
MCDTFVALPPATADGAVIFGKNSDREPNEAQCLEFHPARRWPRGDMVRCTYKAVPQVGRTRAVLLCRPFWMWGAEMGANESGVTIGNEAVFTRMPVERRGALTGMDLVRLALERTDSAQQALETIVALLADHGQGGPCGYQDRRLVYHNSFLIADPSRAWVLETAGPLWAAEQVQNRRAISNRLTIGPRMDACHPRLISTARERGWLRPGEEFDFSQCYRDRFYTFFAAGGPRRRRAEALMQTGPDRLHLSAALDILCDHGTPDYRPGSHLRIDRICAHAANPLTRHAAQTTASLVAELRPGDCTFWATGTAAPCTAVFKPIWLGPRALPDLGPMPTGRFDPHSLWWRHERLHRSTLADYSVRRASFARDRHVLQQELIAAAAAAPADRPAVTRRAFARCRQTEDRWLERARSVPVSTPPGALYRAYWRRQNARAGMPGWTRASRFDF